MYIYSILYRNFTSGGYKNHIHLAFNKKIAMVIESLYTLFYFLQSNSAAQRRNLSLHECDSMGLLKSAGINVPAFRVATSKTEAVTAAADFGEIRFSSDISNKC